MIKDCCGPKQQESQTFAISGLEHPGRPKCDSAEEGRGVHDANSEAVCFSHKAVPFSQGKADIIPPVACYASFGGSRQDAGNSLFYIFLHDDGSNAPEKEH